MSGFSLNEYFCVVHDFLADSVVAGLVLVDGFLSDQVLRVMMAETVLFYLVTTFGAVSGAGSWSCFGNTFGSAVPLIGVLLLLHCLAAPCDWLCPLLRSLDDVALPRLFSAFRRAAGCDCCNVLGDGLGLQQRVSSCRAS